MQTFVPYPDYYMSALVLDRQRLGKQRVETLQILNALAGISKGWTNHPAVRMWRGHENALVEYGVVVCTEWTERGYVDTCADKIKALWRPDESREAPDWWGQVDVHLSHQSNLVRKAPKHYRRFFPFVPDNLDYVWPV